MGYVIYLRKSRVDVEAEARGEGETLVRHEKILIDIAKKQRLHIEQIYKEVVSGETIASRPVMQQLLAEVESGKWDGVLVVEIERLARGDTIDQGIMAQAFKYSDTKIITPNKTFDPRNEFDEEYFEFGLFMSRREYKTINRRLQQGRITSVKEGKYVGNKPPYGYIRQKLERDKGYTLLPHPEQAPIVKMIFDLYVHGDNGKRLGVSLIVKKLNNLGIPAQKGEWTNSSIQTMLRNPVYSGKIRWNSRPAKKKIVDGKIKIERPRAKIEEWVLKEGLHKAIVDEETFRLANEYINTNRPHPAPSQYSIKNPLSGLIRCGMCGRNMVRRPYTVRTQPDSLMCPHSNCKNISSLLYVVEKTVIDMLKMYITDIKVYAEKNKVVIDASILEKNVIKIDDEIHNLQKQFEKSHDLLEQSIYDTQTFLTRTKIINEKIKDLDNKKSDLQEQIKTIKLHQSQHENFIPTVNNIINTYDSIDDIDEKNNLLKQILERVDYFKTEKGTKKNLAGDLKLILYPKIKIN